MPNKPDFWFPAKKRGWGWGPPNCWQGWTVFVIWLALLTAGGIYLMPNTGLFLAYTGVLVIILITICLIKGEKPGWRWEKD